MTRTPTTPLKANSTVSVPPPDGTRSVVSSFFSLRFSAPARGGLFAIVLAIILFALPYGLTNQYQLRIATLLVIYAVFTTGLEFTMGRAGQVSLGHGGFFAIGAYTEGILQTQGIDPWTALLAAIVVGAIAGVIVGLPVLRVAGPYLAVVTIGFALTVQALLYALVPLTKGANGIAGTAFLGSIGLGTGALGTYYGSVLILVVVLALLIVLGLGNFGLGLKAITDSPTLARASGIDVRGVKLGMFTLSAAIASVAGAVFATLGFISPDTFSLQLSIFPVVALVLGGIGTVPGPIIGAFILYGFNQVADRTAQGSALLYGVLLIVVPLLLSKGVAGLFVTAWRKLGFRTVPKAVAETDVAAEDPREAIGALEGATLEIRDVSKSFRSLKAVSNVTVTVTAGEVLGLVGPNGSGKSTLLNMLSGYYAPTSGSVAVDGVDVTKVPLYKRVRSGVLPTFQTAQLMGTRSVKDNLSLGGVVRSRWGRVVQRRQLDALLRTLDASLSLDAPAGSLPEGTRKIVELGRTLLARPRLLLLDEPTSGLSQQEIDRVVSLLDSVKKFGVTILLADHNFEFVGSVCDRVIVLESGRLIAEGTADELRTQENVVEAYLGRGMNSGGGHAASGRG
jgi:ABC-type branched-subunit amino acid transport system ATPase component/ABC-type branched-subunit amino acid transport system permease subunit